MIVLDSAAVVDFLAYREHGAWVEEHLAEDGDVHVPHLIDVEVASALRGMAVRSELTMSDALAALDDLADLPMKRYPHGFLLERIWRLRTHVTAYDAAYIALAETLDATLVTTDLRLARSHGHRARIVAPS